MHQPKVPLSARYKPHLPQMPAPPGGPRRKSMYSAKVTTAVPESARNPRFRGQSSQCEEVKTVSPIVEDPPISPQRAIQLYESVLTKYEQKEILNFPEVYFVGNRSSKIDTNSAARNHGFDNSEHGYRVRPGDHLAYRFEILAMFGGGAFGKVVRAYDHKTHNTVAIKIIVNTDQMHEQGKIEAAILAKLNKYHVPNVVRAYDYFVFRSHICVTFEILGKNLYEVSQSMCFHPLPTRLVKQYAIQMMTALKHCHEAGIVHCDVKPENILILPNNKNSVKLIDFGSGCFKGRQKYEYIQSRFYRAPEVVIGIEYGPPMDIWSMALVFVELLIGKPLFPCDDELELLQMITEIFGPPPRELVRQGKRHSEFFDSQMNLRVSRGKTRRPFSVSLKRVLNTNDPHLCDFITGCLTWDQRERMTAEEALEHPWLKSKEVVIQEKPASMLPGLK